MALINCPECGRSISEYADSCPNCGCPKNVFSKYQNFSDQLKLMDLKRFDTFSFGSYYKNSAKLEPIEWIVLDNQENNRILAISKYGLDSVCFSKDFDKDSLYSSVVSWAQSDLRKWLNNEFYNLAFSDAEKSAMLRYETVPDIEEQEVCGSWFRGKKTGNKGVQVEAVTHDNVFCLSLSELLKYLPDQNMRGCNPTDYAISHFYKTEPSPYADIVDGSISGAGWWLRTGDFHYIGVVCKNGFIRTLPHDDNLYEDDYECDPVSGDFINYYHIAVVRPAIYLKIQ